MKITSTKNRKNTIILLLITAAMGLLSFAPIWLRFGGQYVDYGDYYLQYVPFLKELKRMILSGSFSFSWNSFLGDGFVSAYSYYTVFNPFAYLVILFPDDLILYGTLFATIAKLAVCAWASLIFMRQFCKNDIAAAVGALLYTFSGFTVVNTSYYFFLDAIAVFPFILYGLEKLIRGENKLAFVLAVFANAVINIYFFVSSVIIVVIYVFFRLELYRLSSLKKNFRLFFEIAVFSAIGTGLAAFSLLPSAYAVLGTGKAVESVGSFLRLFWWPQAFLERLRVLVSAVESNRFNAFYDAGEWNSMGFYLPVIGMFGFLCYRKKDWLKKTSIFLLVCLLLPILNGVFNLFSALSYSRWLYGLAILISLMSALWLENFCAENKKPNKKILISLSLFAAGILGVPSAVYFLELFGVSLVNRFCSASQTEYFAGYTAIAVTLILTLINYILLFVFVLGKRKSINIMLAFVVLMGTVNFAVFNGLNTDLLENAAYNAENLYSKTFFENTEMSIPDKSFRIDHPSTTSFQGKTSHVPLNYGLYYDLPSVNNYNSLQNKGSSRFADALGYGFETIRNTPDNGRENIDALLSVKYYFGFDEDKTVPEGFKYIETKNNVDIYENENYIPMGFVYESYCLSDSLESLTPEQRTDILLDTLVIEPKDEGAVKKLLPAYGGGYEKTKLSKRADVLGKNSCSSFFGTSEGFTAEITLKKENIVFFSTPFDSSWEIKVNGKPAEAFEVNLGLLGIRCEEGENEIECIYHNKGVKEGLLISAAFAAVFAAVFAVELKRKKKAESGN